MLNGGKEVDGGAARYPVSPELMKSMVYMKMVSKQIHRVGPMSQKTDKGTEATTFGGRKQRKRNLIQISLNTCLEKTIAVR